MAAPIVQLGFSIGQYFLSLNTYPVHKRPSSSIKLKTPKSEGRGLLGGGLYVFSSIFGGGLEIFSSIFGGGLEVFSSVFGGNLNIFPNFSANILGG